jgi:SAM-dependent methyltransferase
MNLMQSASGGPRGTLQVNGALKGTGLLQSEDEWRARNEELAGSLRGLIAKHCIFQTNNALDVGCMSGELTDRYGEGLPLRWWGVDPDISESRTSPKGAKLSPGFGHKLSFPNQWFDCIVFANVYEHLPPDLRDETIAEFNRVLAPGGILVGQLPNPYFPIESHSRLPFLGVLPRSMQRLYWRLTPTGWDFEKAHFFSVTIRDLQKRGLACGFEAVDIRNFNYSPRAIPKSVRWLAVVHSYFGFLPWSWQFVFRKPLSR